MASSILFFCIVYPLQGIGFLHKMPSSMVLCHFSNVIRPMVQCQCHSTDCEASLYFVDMHKCSIIFIRETGSYTSQRIDTCPAPDTAVTAEKSAPATMSRSMTMSRDFTHSSGGASTSPRCSPRSTPPDVLRRKRKDLSYSLNTFIECL